MREHSFQSGSVTLSGTLHVPKVGNPVAAVVVLHAASSPTRDNPLYAHLKDMLLGNQRLTATGKVKRAKPRLTSATRWYVTADPGEIDGLEFAYLSGNEGPQVESRSGWDVDGVEIRVILDFGAGFIDHRGWFQNPGA